MNISVSLQWWGTLTRDELKHYFKGDPTQYERIVNEQFVSEQYGDRRQELVFIGVNINERKIEDSLNACMLSDEEMVRYQRQINQRIK